MNNILHNNFNNLRLTINNDEYWDFCINKDSYQTYFPKKGMKEDCLISYIDSDDPDCIFFDKLYSKTSYKWDGLINNGVELCNIGYTGVDNGLISYQKDRITNEQFLKIFTESKLKIEKDDIKLHLHQVTGNTGLYDYPVSIIMEDKYETIKLNGGFYQGFFKLDKDDYQILPDFIQSSWNFEFTLRKKDFEKESDKTLNDKYPENKGIFFYMGTRAENKWWLLYEHNEKEGIKKKCDISYFSDDYTDGNYESENGHLLNMDYFQPIVPDKPIEYNDDGYFSGDYLHESCCKSPNKQNSYFADSYINNEYYEDLRSEVDYVSGDYYKPDIPIDVNMKLKTCDGFYLNVPNVYEIKTDNKFIFFNQTCTGFTTSTWNKDNTVILTGITPPDIGNYYTLFNRTCTGYTTNTIHELLDKKEREYNLYGDIYNNAFALRIKDDGSLGYRYLIKDCDAEFKWSIVEEYSAPNVVTEDEWHTIDVRIDMLNAVSGKCRPSYERKMKIYFYVDGKLKLISKELPEFNFRALNDLKEKQEGVPFNISLGGGTQGLAEMITLNYMAYPEYVFPIEKHFAGTFIGELKTFKFYDCHVNYTEIQNNVEFEKNSIKN